MRPDARQRTLLRADAALLEGLVQFGDRDLLALVVGGLQGVVQDVVLGVGVRLAAVALLAQDGLVDLLRLGETLDGVDHGGPLAGLLALLEVVVGEGVLDGRHGNGLAGGLGVGHQLDDDAFLLVGEAAAVRAGGEGGLEGRNVALAHDESPCVGLMRFSVYG